MYPEIKNPPLKEAVLQITFDKLSEGYLEILEKLGESLLHIYPKRTAIQNFNVRLDAEEIPPTNFDSKKVGIKLESHDGNEILMITEDIISLSVINQTYSGWEGFFDKGKSILKLFIEKFEKVNIKRFSTRFLNEITFQLDEGFGDLRLFVNVPYSNLPLSRTSGFLEVFSENSEMLARVQQHLSGRDTEVLFIFDIDVSANLPSITELDSVGERVRGFKNQLFFDVIGNDLIKKLNS